LQAGKGGFLPLLCSISLSPSLAQKPQHNPHSSHGLPSRQKNRGDKHCGHPWGGCTVAAQATLPLRHDWGRVVLSPPSSYKYPLTRRGAIKKKMTKRKKKNKERNTEEDDKTDEKRGKTNERDEKK
jgi:hypothetical protein